MASSGEPMADNISEARARHAAIAARLGTSLTDADREAIKSEIVALYKGVEQQLVELNALKNDVKLLIEQWKSGSPATPGAVPVTAALRAPTPVSPLPAVPSNAPHFAGEKPQLHADHLGASTFIEKGWSKISLGDYSGAETALLKALTLSPNDPQSESLLGWAQMYQEKYDDALLNFQKVLMRQPANALARINVGYICLRKGIFGEAIEHLSKAIRLGNDRKATLYAHFYLGLVYLEREMYEDAQTFFRKTIALGPNLTEAYYELGRAHWFNGQRSDALQAWRDGYTANRFNPWGKRCAEVLATVEKGGTPPRGR
jgi:tetratricopeptide (TPR) repeat protein